MTEQKKVKIYIDTGLANGTIEEETEVSANTTTEEAAKIARDLYEETITWGWNEEDFEPEKKEEKFRVNEYYVSANKQTYKLISKSKTNECWLRLLLIDSIIVTSYVSEEELKSDRKATGDEIALFKRAEYFILEIIKGVEG